MRKLLLLSLGYSCMIFSGCKEHNLSVGFSTNLISNSSSVATPVPVTQPHEVLVEEFTGQSCPNCPAAHAVLDKISADNLGRINTISLYVNNLSETHVPTGGSYDFEDPIATAVSGSAVYGGIGAMPTAGVDRLPYNGKIPQVGSDSWSGIIKDQLNAVDSLNLSISSVYDGAKRVATITATVTYTKSVSTPQNLSIEIVEDSLYDLQKDNAFSSGVQDHYLFLDVFRGMVTSVPNGDVLNVDGNNVKETGRVFQWIYVYALPARNPAIVPLHCRVIAFVNNANGSNVYVQQSAQCKLMQ